MKHLKVAASVVNLAIFVSCGISCSSVPPSPAGAVGRAMLAPHLPHAVANGQAAITQVGGTELTTAGRGGAWSAETAWPQSGGGYDSSTPIPSWQQLRGVINSSNLGSTTLRNSPDVAMEANFDNPTVVNGSFVTGYGGTSFATPRWAGFLALVNQQSVANGKGTVGFINPALYNLGISSSYSGIFRDITSGSNPPTAGDGSGFNAVPGYDLVTGWGSPAGVGLINQLAGTRGSQRMPTTR
jgi:subtilase family serine protease